MFSHVMIGANDLGRMVAFYDAVLARIGLDRTTSLQSVSPAGVIWQKDRQRWPQFALRAPLNGKPASAGNGVQVSFMCSSPEAVDAAWRTALANGGSDEGGPGDRPIYSDDFYAAYVRDPEGNKLCFLYCAAFSDIPPSETA
ncbi:VOC family protein [Chelativorans sp. YIM 93263]|uniref:VOC family protein n=1 Tax=Chelativorans sp. YIM 93263 TaxID=2906648 RepID=UPI002379BF09|nr:VOC family protein [Chelativorans sp. YIM 93263]